jgi:ribonuclease Z
MTSQHLFAAAAMLGSTALASLAPTAGHVAPGIARAQVVATASAVPSDSLKVVLLGTGAGPVVNLQQYGTSTLVEAGGQRFLFDCGRGATLRLAQAGVPIGSITRVFLTHLHSDHVVQLPDLLLTGWSAGRRVVPLTVWGPAGTRAMMEHLLQAFDFDIHVRRDVDERFPPAGIAVVSHDIPADGVVFAEGGVTVTAFLVDHGVVRPAYGYRVDYGGRSVVLSGDTRVSENLIRHARGVDVLIHETIDAEALRGRVDRPSEATIGAIIAHHTTPEEAGTVLRRVAPRLAVYSHAPNTARVMAQTRANYSGPLEGAEDLLTILIGAEIRAEHHKVPGASPDQVPRTETRDASPGVHGARRP